MVHIFEDNVHTVFRDQKDHPVQIPLADCLPSLPPSINHISNFMFGQTIDGFPTRSPSPRIPLWRTSWPWRPCSACPAAPPALGSPRWRSACPCSTVEWLSDSVTTSVKIRPRPFNWGLRICLQKFCFSLVHPMSSSWHDIGCTEDKHHF